MKTAAGMLMGFGEKLWVAIARATMTGMVASTETQKGYEGKLGRGAGRRTRLSSTWAPGRGLCTSSRLMAPRRRRLPGCSLDWSRAHVNIAAITLAHGTPEMQ